MSNTAFVMAVIDPSISSVLVAFFGAVVSVVTVVFAFKTAALAKQVKAQDEVLKQQEIKVAEVIKVTDGMQTKLLAATARASQAEGELKAKVDQQMVTDAVARGVASVAIPTATPLVGAATPVTVVNTEPVPVKVEKR